MKEWRDFYNDNLPSITAVVLISMGFIILSIFLSAQTSQTTTVFYYLTALFLLILSISVIEFIAEKKLKIPNANFFGNNKQKIYIALIAGTVIAFLFGFASRSGMTIAGYSLFLPIQSLTAFEDLGDFFANWVAPFGEELFFRGILFPTLTMIFYITLKNRTRMALPIAVVLALFLHGYIFGVFHFNVFLNQTGFDIVLTHDYITMGVLFSMIWALGMLGFRSIAFPIAWHFVGNNYALNYTTEEIFANTIVFFLIFAFVIELSYKFKGGKT